MTIAYERRHKCQLSTCTGDVMIVRTSKTDHRTQNICSHFVVGEEIHFRLFEAHGLVVRGCFTASTKQGHIREACLGSAIAFKMTGITN